MEELFEFKFQVKTVPSIDDLLTKNFNISSLKNISIYDILTREPIKPIDSLLKKKHNKQKMSLSPVQEVQLERSYLPTTDLNPKSITLIDHSEFALYEVLKEVSDKVNSKIEIKSVLGSINDNSLYHYLNDDINTLFHAAAHKHVPLLEQNSIQSIENNIFGTLKLVKFCSELRYFRNFILISTDKAVMPCNYMGASKRVSELICNAYEKKFRNINFSIVRFGNVMGSSGSVIPLFNSQILKGGPITITHKKMKRYFMTISEAVQLVIQASAIKNRIGHIHILNMGKQIKITEIANKMIKLHGFSSTKFKNIKDDDPDYIKINVTGLRPGEKLEEKLHISNKKFSTQHPKIFSVKEQNLSFEEIENYLSELQNYVKILNFKKIDELLRKSPIFYNSKNLVYHLCQINLFT